tara:strand:- start:1866 stop:2015 length:150 start_codon:yes stop_codon:yes gene_type:complete
MAATKFLNVVNFKLMPEYIDKYFEVYRKLICEGLFERYKAHTGEDTIAL